MAIEKFKTHKPFNIYRNIKQYSIFVLLYNNEANYLARWNENSHLEIMECVGRWQSKNRPANYKF